MSADADATPDPVATTTVWARLRAAGRWLLQRDANGGSPWDERWSSCGPLPSDEGPARPPQQPTDGPLPRR